MRYFSIISFIMLAFTIISCRQRTEENDLLQSKAFINSCDINLFSDMDNSAFQRIVLSSGLLFNSDGKTISINDWQKSLGNAFFLNEQGYLIADGESANECLQQGGKNLRFPLPCPMYQFLAVSSYQCSSNQPVLNTTSYKKIELVAHSSFPNDFLWDMYPNSFAIFKIEDNPHPSFSNYIHFDLNAELKPSQLVYEIGLFAPTPHLLADLKKISDSYETYLIALNRYSEQIQSALSLTLNVQDANQFIVLKKMVKEITEKEKKYHQHLKNQPFAKELESVFLERNQYYEKLHQSTSSEPIKEFLLHIEDSLILAKTCALKRLADSKLTIGLQRSMTYKLANVPALHISRSRILNHQAPDEDYTLLLKFIHEHQSPAIVKAKSLPTELVLGAEKLKEWLACSILPEEVLGVDHPAYQVINHYLNHYNENVTAPYLQALQKQFLSSITPINLEQHINSKQYFITNAEAVGYLTGHLVFNNKADVIGSNYSQYKSLIHSFESLPSESYWHWNAKNINMLNFIYGINKEREIQKLPPIKIYQ